MALTYQFNKIAMQQLRAQLKARQTALPVLKSKEAALRVTIQKQKEVLKELNERLARMLAAMKQNVALWAEFPLDIFELKKVEVEVKKVAGIKTPQLKALEYSVAEFSRFANPNWLTFGIEQLKQLTEMLTEVEVAEKRITILEYALKKTTQKVNLYEKVQIPEYNDAILKIKRYLEDVDNLEKAAQKITKTKQAAAAAEEGAA
ncbi:MAG: V-type ATP synthase subunit D [Spirochaetales bacterium]|nr:V-type ATP synthase subunit D [Spirochaetales bacterium]